MTVDALLEEKVQKNKPRPAPAPTHTEDVLLSSAPSYEVVVETAIPPSEPSQTSNAVDRTPSPSAPLLQSDSLTATIEITPAPVSELSPSIQAVIPGDSLSQQEQVHEESESVVVVTELRLVGMQMLLGTQAMLRMTHKAVLPLREMRLVPVLRTSNDTLGVNALFAEAVATPGAGNTSMQTSR